MNTLDVLRQLRRLGDAKTDDKMKVTLFKITIAQILLDPNGDVEKLVSANLESAPPPSVVDNLGKLLEAMLSTEKFLESMVAAMGAFNQPPRKGKGKYKGHPKPPNPEQN